MATLAELPPLLLPFPLHLKTTGGTARVAGRWQGWTTFTQVTGTAGSYRLSISADGEGIARAAVECSDYNGRLYAVKTLGQLLTQYGERLPCVEIEDRPAFATRGVMLDVSRDRVPTMPELGNIAVGLSGLRFNHLELYTEHTFAYRGHQEAWEGWSPLTPGEVREFDQWCGMQGIQLAANQNCFGHLASWLRHPKYAPLAETHGDWVFDVWPRRGPFSLCPTDPASIEFVRDLLTQLLPNFTTPLVNIGCDETYDIAYGRSKEEVARRGRPAVYLEFVAKVCEVARSLGKRPMFWADIALSHPECIPDIPPDLIALAWGYEPDAPFARWCDLLNAAGREAWVCPGTSSWRSITGRTSERKANIDAAAVCADCAKGFLVCDWGDTGHHQQWPVALNALAYAAAKAWNPAVTPDPRAISLHVFHDRSLMVSGWLDELGDADVELRATCGPLSAPTRTRLPNQSALFIDMFKKWDELRDVGTIDHWRLAQSRIEQLVISRPGGFDPDMVEELDHTLAVARFAAARAITRRKNGDPATRALLGVQRDSLIDEHRRLWERRSREGGLEHSCGYYTGIEV